MASLRVGIFILCLMFAGCEWASVTNLNSNLPGPFTILRPDVTATTVVITWTPSQHAAYYILSYGLSSGNYTKTYSTNAISPATISQLNAGTPYFFMITAVNIFGVTQAQAEAYAIPAP